jgi:septal ring factor EnvC (AmiA/AmiB activator)
MVIDEKILEEERKLLKEDFDNLNTKIKQVEKDLSTMKSNLNAVYGAIQQVDRLSKKLKDDNKDQAVNIATN